MRGSASRLSTLPYRHEFKLGANVPLVWGFEASIALQSYAGAQKGVTWTVTPGHHAIPQRLRRRRLHTWWHRRSPAVSRATRR